ncbi:MAG: lysozyme [Solirubrobacteraceae bacterium]|nr:lysozyme [Patulibacter sp.]
MLGIRRYRTDVSTLGARFISQFEGFRARPYHDAVGKPTIGFGHTEGVTMQSKALTLAKARTLLQSDLTKTYAPPVARLLKAEGIKTTAAEFNALVSAVYNLGPGILDRGRTLGDAIRSKDRHRIGDAFLVYDKADGQTLAGLTRRRHAERTLFLTGKYS